MSAERTLAQRFTEGLALISHGHYHGSVPCDVVYRLNDVAAAGEAAIAWDAARREALRLRDERNACKCEHEEQPDHLSNFSGTTPCWKDAEWDVDMDPVKPRDWCDPCAERQGLHKQYRLANRRRGALMRSLQRTCARATTP